MNNFGKAVVSILVLLCADALIVYVFPSIVDLGRWIIDIFLILVLEFLVYRRTSLLLRIFSKDGSNVMSGTKRLSVTPVLGISIASALILGALMQTYLFPEIANLPGLMRDLGVLALPFVFSSIVLTYYQKK